jgi:cephalosporin hydroxylase
MFDIKKMIPASEVYNGTFAREFHQFKDKIGNDYATWFYTSCVWQTNTYCGILTLKSPEDMWNYQEILSERRPSLIIEFGTFMGGSALYFANVMQNFGSPYRILTADPTDHVTSSLVKSHPNIERIMEKSVTEKVYNRILDLQKEFPGQIFCILDGDHSAENVYDELKMLSSILKKGDYVIIEDSNLNGHPVPVDMKVPGPWEAFDQYKRDFPNDYIQDLEREKKFGWTFATDGYLIKT